MKKQEILDIAKNLILISGKYNKVDNKKEKDKLLSIFDNYEKQLKNNKTKYASTVLEFIVDLRGDLENNRKLNIDNLKTDEYLENYLLIKREINNYNSLILMDSYRKIFDELIKNKQDNKIINFELEKLYNNFVLFYKKLNAKLISKNILIFTSFDRIIPKKYLLNLYKFLKEDFQKQKVLEMLQLLKEIILEVKKYGIKNYNTGKINYKYIGFSNVNGKSVLNEKIIDCSKIAERTGNYKYEYKIIINNLK